MNLGISRLVRNIAGKYGAYDKVELGFPKQGLNLETLQAWSRAVAAYDM